MKAMFEQQPTTWGDLELACWIRNLPGMTGSGPIVINRGPMNTTFAAVKEAAFIQYMELLPDNIVFEMAATIDLVTRVTTSTFEAVFEKCMRSYYRTVGVPGNKA
jgi:hypothetical protein